jgi:hypothetical protein
VEICQPLLRGKKGTLSPQGHQGHQGQQGLKGPQGFCDLRKFFTQPVGPRAFYDLSHCAPFARGSARRRVLICDLVAKVFLRSASSLGKLGEVASSASVCKMSDGCARLVMLRPQQTKEFVSDARPGSRLPVAMLADGTP